MATNPTQSSAATQTLTPYLITRNAEKAIAFYIQAFGARELFRLAEGNGKVSHAELEIGNTRFMLTDEHPDFGALGPVTIGGTPVSLHIAVDDVDAAVTRAEAAGATVLRPAKDEFYGERTAMLSDPFGHKWHLATVIEQVSPAEMQKRWSAMLAEA